MLHAITMRAHLLVHAILDLLEMELIVKISTNAIQTHVIQMPPAQILWDHTHAVVTLDTLEMEHTVKTMMNAIGSHHPATKMQPVSTMLDHMCAHASLAILEMELNAMVSFFID